MPEIIPNLHPLAVHFPITLVLLSALFHIAALAMRGKPCAQHCAILSHSMLWLGALAVLPTALLGWQAFSSVNHDEAGHIAMLAHRTWALITVAVLVLLAGWDAWRSKVDTTPTGWHVAAVAGAAILIAVTAWHGGELVYRHGIGVMALPATEAGEGHHHHHDDTASSAGEVAMPMAEAHDHHEH